MACQRNRIIELVKYLEKQGIEVNIGKNKARGNKGIFRWYGDKKFRIDISKNLDEPSILSVLVHEYAHFVHYKYDPKLESLDFVFSDYDDEINEELINVTVEDVPKSTAQMLYNKKDQIHQEIKALSLIIKSTYPEFKSSERFRSIERKIKNPAKYLLKYDRVRVFNKIYSVETLAKDFDSITPIEEAYIVLKSKQRALRRINSRIRRLNNYYNKPTELFARFVEMYFCSNTKVRKLAPRAAQSLDFLIDKNEIPQFVELNTLMK